MKLKSTRYEEIKRSISELLVDYNINQLPIDLDLLIKRMNIKVIYAKDKIMRNKNRLKIIINILEHNPSYFYYDNINQQFYIYLDNFYCTKERQRYSLTHEIVLK